MAKQQLRWPDITTKYEDLSNKKKIRKYTLADRFWDKLATIGFDIMAVARALYREAGNWIRGPK